MEPGKSKCAADHRGFGQCNIGLEEGTVPDEYQNFDSGELKECFSNLSDPFRICFIPNGTSNSRYTNIIQYNPQILPTMWRVRRGLELMSTRTTVLIMSTMLCALT